jgi:predicted TIM-barrel fold metal-dependent hydrolase
MFVTPEGKKLFVIDGHTHLWDARPENRRNRYGLTFIEVFWNGHNGLTPPDQRWSWERFLHYGVENAARDLFEDGYCDMAIMLPTYLYEFYTHGFNTTAQCAVMKDAYPEKIILAGRMDPRDGQRGLDQLEADHDKWKFRSVKVYTAEWAGDSKGYSLKDDSVGRYMEKCRGLGIDIIHVHKGPTIHPLNMDAFDVKDVDDVATAFPDLKFVVDHCGIPRIDDFCWIANQEPNVYGGLAVVSAFVHMRPRYFASMMADLLWFLGPDRLIFGTDYGIYSPKWVIEEFMKFEFDEATAREAGTELSLDVKAKILGLNAARLYGINVPAECHQAEPIAPPEREETVRAAE